MPRRRRERRNSNNYSSPVDGRLYIEYWIHRPLGENEDDDPIGNDPIYIARPNIHYTPPLTKYDAMEYVEGEYNREVRGLLPRPDLIEYTVDFSTSNANDDVHFEPSNVESTGYAAQIIVKIRTNDHDLVWELLNPPTPEHSVINNNNGNNGHNGNNNATTIDPNNNTKSIYSNGSNEPPKTIKPKGLPFNGGKRRTKKRNTKRKVSRRRR
jgi:hypothetical protein